MNKLEATFPSCQIDLTRQLANDLCFLFNFPFCLVFRKKLFAKNFNRKSFSLLPFGLSHSPDFHRTSINFTYYQFKLIIISCLLTSGC